MLAAEKSLQVPTASPEPRGAAPEVRVAASVIVYYLGIQYFVLAVMIGGQECHGWRGQHVIRHILRGSI